MNNSRSNLNRRLYIQVEDEPQPFYREGIVGPRAIQKEDNTEGRSTLNRESLPQIPVERHSGICFQHLQNDTDEFSEYQLLSETNPKSNHKAGIVSSPNKKTMGSVGGIRTAKILPYSSQIHPTPFLKAGESLDRTDLAHIAGAIDNKHSKEPSISNKLIKFEIVRDLEREPNQSFKLSQKSLQNREDIEKKNIIKVHFQNSDIIPGIAKFLCAADLIRLGHVLRFQKSSLQAKIIQNYTIESLIKGFEKSDQRWYWKFYVDFEKIKEMNQYTFTSSFFKKRVYQREINKDIDRTCQDHPYFQSNEGRNALFHVLIALSDTVKEVGYIQGLNSIVATFLTVLREVDSYWMMVYLMKKRGLKQLMCPKFPLVDIWNFQLKCFMHQYMPEMYQFILNNGLTIEYYATPWFLTLFTDYFQIPTMIKIWNIYLIRGEKFFIQLALGIFGFYQEDLLKKDIDEMADFIRQNLRQGNSEALLKKALHFKVTTRLLNQLKAFFEKEHQDPSFLLFKKDKDSKFNFETKKNSKDKLIFESSERNLIEEFKLYDLKPTPKRSHLASEKSKLMEDQSLSENISEFKIGEENFSPIKNEGTANTGLDLSKPYYRLPHSFKPLTNMLNLQKEAQHKQLKIQGDSADTSLGKIEQISKESKKRNSIDKSNYLVETHILDSENVDHVLNIEPIRNITHFLCQENSNKTQVSHLNVIRGPQCYKEFQFSHESLKKNDDRSPSSCLTLEDQCFEKLAKHSSGLRESMEQTPSTRRATLEESQNEKHSVETGKLLQKENRIVEQWTRIDTAKKSTIEFSIKKPTKCISKPTHYRANSQSGNLHKSMSSKMLPISSLVNYQGTSSSSVTIFPQSKLNKSISRDSLYESKLSPKKKPPNFKRFSKRTPSTDASN